ncbi:hypothetical protein [Nesterenkonia sp. K-15-9-6]|uniref:hypothetical protein n=1 Tax=Nesterenkonia sp. K-15-9-6 TaxID=3093918 RepID=UPI0040450DF1
MTHPRRRVLLLSDDDVVTGTLRRLARIGEHLTAEADVVMATLAGQAAAGPQAPSFPLQRIGSHHSLNADREVWERDYLLPRLDRLMSGFAPDVLVVDGDFPARVLDRLDRAHPAVQLHVTSAAETAPVGRPRARSAGAMVHLGEITEDDGESADATAPLLDAAVLGATGGALTEDGGGGGARRPCVVLDLPGLSPDTTAAVEDLALEFFAARRPEWRVALLDSAVARRAAPGVERISGGATAELVSRTVGAVAVPGHRAVHTWSPTRIPTLWLTEGPGGEKPIRGAAERPRRRLRPDQQEALRRRATQAVQAGWGHHTEVEGPQDIDALRARLTGALEVLDDGGWAPAGPARMPEDGAEQAAEAILRAASAQAPA